VFRPWLIAGTSSPGIPPRLATLTELKLDVTSRVGLARLAALHDNTAG
jgi:hypothetical protein